jgi:hypothetical protein
VSKRLSRHISIPKDGYWPKQTSNGHALDVSLWPKADM